MPLYSLLSSTEPSHKPECEKVASPTQRSSFDSEETCTASSPRTARHWHRRSESAWILSTITLTITTLSLLLYLVIIHRSYSCSRYGTFESGFKTDLEAAKQFTDGQLKTFSGALAFHENGTMYRVYNQNEPQYTGYPNPDIDAAWHNLLYGSGIDLPTDMIGRLRGKTWEEIRGGKGGMWRTGLDVFHQLHCLDYVRKALYPDYYPQDDISRLFWMHVEHCIDYIRQALMCFADATPVRLLWRKESQFLLPQFDQLHTCRNFELLKSFSDEHALELYVEENERDIKQAIKDGIL